MCSRLSIEPSLATPSPKGIPAIFLDKKSGRSLAVKPNSSRGITEALFVFTVAVPCFVKFVELKS